MIIEHFSDCKQMIVYLLHVIYDMSNKQFSYG